MEIDGPWAAGDFAATAVREPLGAITLPFSNPFQVDFATQRVVAAKFQLPGKYGNEQDGPTLRLCFVPGAQSRSVNAVFSEARGRYPIPLFEMCSGDIFFRGWHVITDVQPAAPGVTGKWTFRVLNPSWQLIFPPIREWIKADGKLLPRTAGPDDRASWIHAGAQWVVGKAAQPTTQPIDALVPTTRAAPAPDDGGGKRLRSGLDRCQTIMLDWFLDSATQEGGNQVLERDATVRAACRALGGVSPALVSHRVEEVLGSSRRIQCIGWPRHSIAPPPPPLFEPNEKLRERLMIDGGRVFRSRLEMEHYLLLCALAGPVMYESVSFPYVDPNGTPRHYRLDFQLPGVAHFEEGRDTPPGFRFTGANLLVESKASKPSAEALYKCEQVVAGGHNVVLMYGYPGPPLLETLGRSVEQTYRDAGLEVVTFGLDEDGRGRIVRRDCVWCMDKRHPGPYLRPIESSGDPGPRHPRLLRLYEQIRALSAAWR